MKKLRISPDERTEFLKNITGLIDKGNISQLKDLSGYISKLDATKIVKPTVYIMSDVMAKMEALVKHSSTEISWHCLVKRNIEENCYLIYDLVMFPQTNTATTTSTDQDEYAKWLNEIMMDEDESKFDNMRMHGHSHVNMSVFSSTVDDGYQTELLTNIKDGDYYIFMILNKKKDMCTLLYDFNQQVLFENADITVEIVTTDKTAINVWAKNQIENYCKKPTVTTAYRSTLKTIEDYDDPYDYYYGNKSNKTKYQPRYQKYLHGGK